MVLCGRAVIAYLIFMLFFSGGALAETKSDLEQTGDILQFGIPAGAAVISIIKGDGRGFAQLLEGGIYTAAAPHAIKYAVNRERPNGRDYSMPSGHTAAAVHGASYLQFRYGWKYGIPAYALAGVVGYSRVESDCHYWTDVIAGAALATGIQYMITRAGFGFSNIGVTPEVTEDHISLSMNYRF